MNPDSDRRAIETATDEYFRQLFERSKLRFVFTSSTILIDGNTAVERVTYTAEAWLAGAAVAVADRGKGMHVYRREKPGSWRLILDIWNSDTPRTT